MALPWPTNAGAFGSTPDIPNRSPFSGTDPGVQRLEQLARRCSFTPPFLQSQSARRHVNRSLCLVDCVHSFFIHPATVHFDFRESSFDLTKIRRRRKVLSFPPVSNCPHIPLIEVRRASQWQTTANFTTPRLTRLIGFLRFPTSSIPAALRIGSRFFWSINSRSSAPAKPEGERRGTSLS
jgi:hypothetical protein